jgi:hypothetical protein
MNINFAPLTTADGEIEPFKVTRFIKSIIALYLHAAELLADTSLSDSEVLEELDIKPYVELWEYKELLFCLLEQLLKDNGLHVEYHNERFNYFGCALNPEDMWLFNVLKKSVPSNNVGEFFFGLDDNLYYNDLQDNCSRDVDIRAALILRLIHSIRAIANNFPGKHEEHCEAACDEIDALRLRYTRQMATRVKTQMTNELKKLPVSYAIAGKSKRVQLAKKHKDAGGYIDLLNIRAMETLNVLTAELASLITLQIKRAVTVELSSKIHDEPDGYVCTQTPHYEMLIAAELVLAHENLPDELRCLVSKSIDMPWFLKNLSDPEQSIVIFEGIGLTKITLAEQLVIHIGAPTA